MKAGLGRRGPQPREMDPAEWDSAIEVSLRGVLNCVHAVVNPMVEAGWGRIITISSGAGSSGVGIALAPYSAGKRGGLGFMRSLALENAQFGVTANSVTANSVALGLMDNTAGGATPSNSPAGFPSNASAPQPTSALSAFIWLAKKPVG